MELSQLEPPIGLFTDGSSWSQDRSGGWAWLAIGLNEGECVGSGAASDTTNNRMELQAWIEGLKAVHQALGPCEIIVFSDSEYVGKGAMNRSRKRNKNVDLWDQLDAAIDSHKYVEFEHVRGHNGNVYNEKVDVLANIARRQGV